MQFKKIPCEYFYYHGALCVGEQECTSCQATLVKWFHAEVKCHKLFFKKVLQDYTKRLFIKEEDGLK